MTRFRIECGKHRGTIEALSIGEAWRKLTEGQTDGFTRLARVRTNGGVWKYTTPEWLDRQAWPEECAAADKKLADARKKG